MAEAEAGGAAVQIPLVEVTFQKNPARKQKYLEAEPKALGITQIGLSVYQISSASVMLSQGLRKVGEDLFIAASLMVIVAGSVALAAQNLHRPTLRACLVMQIIACAASVFNLIFSLINLENMHISCWHYHYDYNNTSPELELCHQAEGAYLHLQAESVLIQAALFAISATLAAYCCKVVNCCSPAPQVPVITVQVPPSGTQDDNATADS
ncbi:membrane-spanning 4-domains subfamily A member 4A-like [Genypterus blacodes]|uniref:membrane-spanning 4-domains subfamily A member 4A-like n=1 Tax=Genypterus blacodes TaxID=154954 RepID=UPI003F75C393